MAVAATLVSLISTPSPVPGLIEYTYYTSLSQTETVSSFVNIGAVLFGSSLAMREDHGRTGVFLGLGILVVGVVAAVATLYFTVPLVLDGSLVHVVPYPQTILPITFGFFTVLFSGLVGLARKKAASTRAKQIRIPESAGERLPPWPPPPPTPP